ncbi:phosphopantetheine adenylyltransferase 1 [Dorcoceras hygrometricum]|uniref:Phosphopantetheine adenylyltransferase 1 n=1 Tax=Dorcoceras hygrometricum TaxID=472368 RepID=A0A2Z7CSQ6_9LAMI|nr:phosphopantetheine adenylyltransferase 1 [Dorcoceras hygrometricum]
MSRAMYTGSIDVHSSLMEGPKQNLEDKTVIASPRGLPTATKLLRPLPTQRAAHGRTLATPCAASPARVAASHRATSCTEAATTARHHAQQLRTVVGQRVTSHAPLRAMAPPCAAGVDEAAFADDFAQWLDDFVARNSEPEIVVTRTITEAAGSNSPVVVKDMNRAVSSIFTNEEHMSIDDLLLQISDDMLLPSITATEITKIRLEAVMPKRGKEVAADLPIHFLEVAADLFNHLLQIKFEIVDMLQVWMSWKRLRKEFVRQIDGKDKEIDR